MYLRVWYMCMPNITCLRWCRCERQNSFLNFAVFLENDNIFPLFIKKNCRKKISHVFGKTAEKNVFPIIPKTAEKKYNSFTPAPSFLSLKGRNSTYRRCEVYNFGFADSNGFRVLVLSIDGWWQHQFNAQARALWYSESLFGNSREVYSYQFIVFNVETLRSTKLRSQIVSSAGVTFQPLYFLLPEIFVFSFCKTPETFVFSFCKTHVFIS